MPDVLHIAICEDERAEIEKLLSLLKNGSIHNQCAIFMNGEELLASYQPYKYDLLLMDIYMDGALTGIQTVQKIRDMDKNVSIAFITNSKDFALESYRLSVMKYIEKPVTAQALADTLYLAQLKKNNMPAIALQKNRVSHRIPLAVILYMEQQGHKLFIHQTNGASTFYYEKLSALSQYLPDEHFFLPHKSFAVNLGYVKYIDFELRCFVMSDNTNIPIKREYLTKAKQALEHYLFDQTRGLLP